MTRECVKSLKDYNIHEVIVVDDGSPIKYKIDGVTQINKEVNEGFPKTVNMGWAKTDGDYIVTANNDLTFIDPHSIDRLIEPLKNGYDISSIRTTDSDGWETQDIMEENAKFGSLWAMKRSVYDELGDLETCFGRGYFEDLDYWHRALDEGFKIVKNHNGLVEHVGKATFNTLSGNIYNESMVRFKEKWGNEAILFVQEQEKGNVIVLVDKYDLTNYTKEQKAKIRQGEISPKDARKALGL